MGKFFFSTIYDFSLDSLYINSFYWADTPITVHYRINKDTLVINDTTILNYKIADNELHLYLLNSDTVNSLDDTRINEIVLVRASSFPEGSKLTRNFLKGPFFCYSDSLGSDTLEFVNDSLYLQRNIHGFQQFYSWKLHEIEDTRFIELWNEYTIMGYPALFLPIKVSENEVKTSFNYNKNSKMSFKKIGTNYNKPDITGTWNTDSCKTIHNDMNLSDTIIHNVSLTLTLTEDSFFFNNKRMPASYIYNYTGEELILTEQVKDHENGQYYDDYTTCKIIHHSDSNLIFKTFTRRRMSYHDIYYLSKIDIN